MMKNWRALSLVAVFVAAVFVWQMLPRPTQAAEMKLPPGITLQTLAEISSPGIPGVKKLTAFKLTVKPGAKWPNMVNEANVWDLCYEVSGTMSVRGTDGKVSTIKPGTAFTIPAGAKIPLIFNTGKVPAVDVFWHVETQ